MQPSFVAGIRLGIPFAVVGFVLSLSFGVLARQAGFSALQAVVTAAIGARTSRRVLVET